MDFPIFDVFWILKHDLFTLAQPKYQKMGK